MYIYIHRVPKKRAPYNNVNNLRIEVPNPSPFEFRLGLPIWHILTNCDQYILKNEDSREFFRTQGVRDAVAKLGNQYVDN